MRQCITERAKSRTQQRFMGMVHAYKEGNLDTSGMSDSLVKRIKNAAASMSGTEAEKFAKTKHKGLPERVKEGKDIEAKDKRVADCKRMGLKKRSDILAYCKQHSISDSDCAYVLKVCGKNDVKEQKSPQKFTFIQFLVDSLKIPPLKK